MSLSPDARTAKYWPFGLVLEALDKYSPTSGVLAGPDPARAAWDGIVHGQSPYSEY